MKSGLEKNILEYHDPLQSCCCPMQKNLPRKAWLVGISKGAQRIS